MVNYKPASKSLSDTEPEMSVGRNKILETIVSPTFSSVKIATFVFLAPIFILQNSFSLRQLSEAADSNFYSAFPYSLYPQL